MNLTLTLDPDQKIWSVTNKEGVVAQLFLDSWEQVKAVIVFPCSAEEKEAVLQLACSHVANFLRFRSHVPFHFLPLVSEVSQDKHLTDTDSRNMMSFSKIDKRIKKGSADEMVSLLETLQVPVIYGIVKSFSEAIELAMASVVLPAVGTNLGLTCTPVELGWDSSVKLEFSTKKVFEFWNTASKPNPNNSFDLHIVAGYHPVNSGKRCLMINGDTDAYIGGKAVRAIYSPKESRTAENFGSTWGRVNHPFKITGSTFALSVLRTTILSQEGIDELVSILKAALALSDQYIGSSGGFNPPYPYPHNRFNELKIPAEKRLHIRGSEAKCVWEYKTLEQEGELEKAYVPKWFYDENWLGLYETAECAPGIF